METSVPFERARALVLAEPPRLPTEPVALLDADGRTLSADVRSPRDLPPHANSALDGFAVRASSVAPGSPMRVDETAWPGQPPGPPLARDCARRIMTGAPIPPGADAVVPVEWTDLNLSAWQSDDLARVAFERVPQAGHGIRPRAGGVARGQTLVLSGHRLTPGAIGLLAAAGIERVDCARRARVAIVTTGDEVVPHGQLADAHQIPDANGPLLCALVRSEGATAHLAHAPDNRHALAATLRAALDDCDVLLVTGGVSMGAADDVPGVLSELGVRWRFAGVRQRPGKPLRFGDRDGVPVFGLPGNPVSTAVCFQIYVRPLLRAMAGASAASPTATAVLAEPMGKVEGLHTFARVTLAQEGERLVAQSAGGQASNQLHALAAADGLAHLPEAWASADAGTIVQVERLQG
jgi:molybdopterin molybdotransferase